MSTPSLPPIPAVQDIRPIQSAVDAANANGPSSGQAFGELLNRAVNEVNAAQNAAQAQVQAFSSGSQEVSLEDVMVSVQKANLSLQGMIAVRNKLVEAYKDISNLPL